MPCARLRLRLPLRAISADVHPQPWAQYTGPGKSWHMHRHENTHCTQYPTRQGRKEFFRRISSWSTSCLMASCMLQRAQDNALLRSGARTDSVCHTARVSCQVNCSVCFNSLQSHIACRIDLQDQAPLLLRLLLRHWQDIKFNRSVCPCWSHGGPAHYAYRSWLHTLFLLLLWAVSASVHFLTSYS